MNAETQTPGKPASPIEIQLSEEHIAAMACEMNAFEPIGDRVNARKSIEDMYRMAYGLKVVWV